MENECCAKLFIMFYEKERAKELDPEQLVVCRCPNCCSSGYQVSIWNGEDFYFDEQPNDWFDKDVIAFMILSEDGYVLKL